MDPEEKLQRDMLIDTRYRDEEGHLKTDIMLQDAFVKKYNEMVKQKKNHGTIDPQITVNIKANRTDVKPSDTSFSRENLLVYLFDIYDDLTNTFSKVKHTSAIANDLTCSINKIGSCICALGGDVKEFNPLDHISGLQIPNLHKNANKVIDTTKQCYILGSIRDASVDKSGKTVTIVFEGQDENIHYVANGSITPKTTWIGNEAIDYVYTPQSGKMSVKALNEEGKWIDKSDCYEVYWELEETDLNSLNDKNEATQKEVVAAIENKIEKNEENQENNEFPIIEES